jgi:hypothetical protein
VRGGGEAFHSHRVHPIVFKMSIFKVVFELESLQNNSIRGWSLLLVGVVNIHPPRVAPKALGSKQNGIQPSEVRGVVVRYVSVIGSELSIAVAPQMLQGQLVHTVARRVKGGLPILHGNTLPLGIGGSDFHPVQPLVVGRQDAVQLRVVGEIGRIGLNFARNACHGRIERKHSRRWFVRFTFLDLGPYILGSTLS